MSESRIDITEFLKKISNIKQLSEVEIARHEKIWVTACEDEIRVCEMSTPHILNTIKCLKGKGNVSIPEGYLGGKEVWLEIFYEELKLRNKNKRDK